MAKAKAAAVIEIPCSFGDVSIGESTCRIGVNVARSALPLGTADQKVCGKRLIGSIVALPGSDNPDQPQIFTDEAEVASAFDVKRVSFDKQHLSFGLTFSRESVDTATLASFPKRAGRIIANDIQAIPERESKNGEGE